MSDAGCELPVHVPVFPLPEVCLFPGQHLPLHVFEPRYRAMTADCLGGDGHMAVAMLRPGYEKLYFTLEAPIEPIVGVGRIVASETLEDGKYNFILRGLTRARIVGELGGKCYRVARIEAVNSVCPVDCVVADAARRELRDALCALGQDSIASLAACHVRLSDLSDQLAAMLPMPAALRQFLLGETDALARVRTLAQHVQTLRRLRDTPLSKPGNMN